MSVRKLIAAIAVLASFAVPAHADEGIGVSAQFAGSVCSSPEDPTGGGARDGLGTEQVVMCCHYYGQLTPQGQMQYQVSGQAVVSSTSVSQPELTVLQCTLISPAQGIAGERPTLTYTLGPIGCPGAACAIGGQISGWPVRPVTICVDGYVSYGPLPVVERNIPRACKSHPL